MLSRNISPTYEIRSQCMTSLCPNFRLRGTLKEKDAPERDNKFLAAFWFIDGEFYGPRETRKSDKVEVDDRYLKLPFDYENEWRNYKPSNCSGKFDDYPRGQIIFDCMLFKFIVVAPRDIIYDTDFQTSVREEFGLPESVIFKASN